jgi:hypothetical protein
MFCTRIYKHAHRLRLQFVLSRAFLVFRGLIGFSCGFWIQAAISKSKETAINLAAMFSRNGHSPRAAINLSAIFSRNARLFWCNGHVTVAIAAANQSLATGD